MTCLATGCTTGLTAQQRQWLTEGHAAYERKQYRVAVERLTRFLTQVEGKPEVASALYIRGQSYALTGLRRQAYSDLQAAVQSGGDADVVWRAQVVLGTLYFEDGRWDAAAANLRAALARMPTGPPMDKLLWRLGLSLERSGRWEEAREAFAQIPRRVPGSQLVGGAERRLQLNAEHFAVQCGVFVERGNAEALRSSLAKSGFPASVRREPRPEGSRYVVLVGKYTAYEEAVRQLGAVRRQVPQAVLWP